jgi:hypothetical protein
MRKVKVEKAEKATTLRDLGGVGSDAVLRQSFADISGEIDGGLKQRAERTRATLDELQSERDALSKVLRLAAVSRLVDSDRTLREQLDAADARSKAAMKGAKESEAALGELRSLAVEEIKRLEKLFG